MSLIDAMLLDPAPFAIFVAYRADGNKGCGTCSDPYNASTKYASAITVSTITNIGADPLEATATTTKPHEFSNGDAVTIDGVTGNGAARWNGTFVIYDVSTTTFKYYMVNLPAASAGGDMTVSKVLAFRFDEILNSLAPNTAIHLGPTTPQRPYLTRGYSDDSSAGWQPKAGMKLRGSGIDVTTLQLVASEVSDAHFFAIGHTLGAGGSTAPNSMDYLEVSDLTIDCNLMLRPSSAVVCGAIRLMGNHARVRGVKTTHWGCKSTSTPAYVIAMITAEPLANAYDIEDEGIENCIAVEPAASVSGAKIAILHAGAKESTLSAQEGYGTGPHIRNCYVDCGTLTTDPEYRALSMGWCRAGVVEGNQIHNATFGGPYQDRASIRDIIVRNNVYRNVAHGILFDLGQLGDSLIASDADLAMSGGLATIINGGLDTATLALGDRVNVVTEGIVEGEEVTTNGIYEVISVEYGSSPELIVRSIGTEFANVTSVKRVLSVSRVIIERNLIDLASGIEDVFAVFIHDNILHDLTPGLPDCRHGDIIIRNNRVRYLDGVAPDDVGAGLIQVDGAKNVIVQNNILETISVVPIVSHRCGEESYFDNRIVSEELVTVADHTANDFEERFEIPAEDALTMACFDAV